MIAAVPRPFAISAPSSPSPVPSLRRPRSSPALQQLHSQNHRRLLLLAADLRLSAAAADTDLDNVPLALLLQRRPPIMPPLVLRNPPAPSVHRARSKTQSELRCQTMATVRDEMPRSTPKSPLRTSTSVQDLPRLSMTIPSRPSITISNDNGSNGSRNSRSGNSSGSDGSSSSRRESARRSVRFADSDLEDAGLVPDDDDDNIAIGRLSLTINRTSLSRNSISSSSRSSLMIVRETAAEAEAVSRRTSTSRVSTSSSRPSIMLLRDHAGTVGRDDKCVAKRDSAVDVADSRSSIASASRASMEPPAALAVLLSGLMRRSSLSVPASPIESMESSSDASDNTTPRLLKRLTLKVKSAWQSHFPAGDARKTNVADKWFAKVFKRKESKQPKTPKDVKQKGQGKNIFRRRSLAL